MWDPSDDEDYEEWYNRIRRNEEMLEQLPKDSCEDVSVLGEYEPCEDPEPGEEYCYSMKYDDVLRLPVKKYTGARAKMKFNGLCVLQGLRPVGPIFYTARFWCLRVVKKSV